jgi:hypothetical protein
MKNLLVYTNVFLCLTYSKSRFGYVEFTSPVIIIKEVGSWVFFSLTSQDARIDYFLVRYRSHWYSHVANVLLNSIHIEKNVSLHILKGFCRDYILGRKVCLTKTFEIWTTSLKISIFLLIKNYFSFIIYVTSIYSWGLELHCNSNVAFC